jgi:hypothetical protein
MSTRVSKQIGWSQESNLLYEILRKLGELAGIASKVKPYKVYSAIITDDEPDVAVTILENTIGNIAWSIANTGEYRADLIGAFPENKTWCSMQPSTAAASPYYVNVASGAPDSIMFYTGGESANRVFIEIRVYN